MSAALSRSDFVKWTASFAGSFVLLAGRDGVLTPAKAQAAADFSPNAWLRIHPDDTISVFINRSEMGQGVMTGLPTLVAEELDVPLARMTVEVASPAPQYLYPGQREMSTGGSVSLRSSWKPLRQAGANARAMLVQAAAQRWSVDPVSLTTRDGKVVHAASNRSATYGSLAATAAKLPLPSDVALKVPEQFALIGKRGTQRLDVPSKVDGSAHYGIDVKVPGMRYAAIARCPVFGGTVKRFDANQAKAIKGVLDAVQISRGVAVIADNTWAAFRGRDALVVEWDEGPRAGNESAAMFAEAERLARDPSRSTATTKRGDVSSLSGRSLDAIYYGPFLAHATLEPMNATAHVRDDSCEIWAPTQAQSRAQAAAMRITGLPAEKIVIHTTMLGGGFGRRLQSDYIEEAVELSKAIKAPVKVTWSRADDLQHDFYRPMIVDVMRGVLDAGGRIAGLSCAAYGDSGSEVADATYQIPNLLVTTVAADHGVPTGAWRAPNANWTAFVMESFLDELAHAAGQDPVAFRLAHLLPDSAAAACLKLAAQRANWGTARAGISQGVALGFWNGSTCATVADVALNGSMPKVRRVTAAVAVGIAVNPEIVVAQTRSGVNYGLSAALRSKITLKNGRVEQANFDTYPVMRIAEAPAIDVAIVPSDASPTGIGELGVPAIAPAVSNAIFAATGKRIRRLPFSDAQDA